MEFMAQLCDIFFRSCLLLCNPPGGEIDLIQFCDRGGRGGNVIVIPSHISHVPFSPFYIQRINNQFNF